MRRTLHEEHRRFVRDLALLLGLPLVVLVLVVGWWQPWPHPYDVPPGTDIFTVAAGDWDWAGADGSCRRNPHAITFSMDHRVMTLRYSRPIADSTGETRSAWEYDIHEVSRHHIRGQIRGETRTTAAGEPVVWDLVLRSPDEYRWHRTDWPFMVSTNPVRRCPAAGSSPQP